jgi:hypothetical protein
MSLRPSPRRRCRSRRHTRSCPASSILGRARPLRRPLARHSEQSRQPALQFAHGDGAGVPGRRGQPWKAPTGHDHRMLPGRWRHRVGAWTTLHCRRPTVPSSSTRSAEALGIPDRGIQPPVGGNRAGSTRPDRHIAALLAAVPGPGALAFERSRSSPRVWRGVSRPQEERPMDGFPRAMRRARSSDKALMSGRPRGPHQPLA